MSARRRGGGGYSAVPQDENDPIDIQYRPRPQPEDKWEVLVNKLFTLVVFALAAATWYYADVYQVIFHADPRINFTMFAVALALGFFCTCIFLYIFIDNYIHPHDNSNYLETHPRSITILSFTGVAFWITAVIALWPVWKISTIPIMGVNLIALMVSPSLFVW